MVIDPFGGAVSDTSLTYCGIKEQENMLSPTSGIGTRERITCEPKDGESGSLFVQFNLS